MHVIRLKKVALKNNLSYSLVVITATKAAKSNQFIEKLGHYKPLVDKLRNKYTFVDLTRFFF